MQIDLLWGPESKKMFGINRCKVELLNKIENKVDLKKISYSPKNRILNFLDFLTYTPFNTLIKGRKNAVKHILSHSEAHQLFFLPLKRSVVTCYDITPYLYKYGNPISRLKVIASFYAMKKAKRIITISDFTKREYVKHFGYPEEKITVATIGVNHDKYYPIKDKTKLEKIRTKYGLNSANLHIIYVGNEEPRMNIDIMFKGFAIARKQFPNLKFIKGGDSNIPGQREKLIQLAKKLDIEKDIIWTGYITEQDLPILYNLANINLYLVSYAGFGLSALEGMACGTPTISSNVASMPELVGDGGIQIAPKDIDQLASTIIKILSNSKLNKELSRKGVKQAQNFTWENWAEKTIEAYHLVKNK
jgi:glycosyltransferase involved in cell wall biosynthesis